MDHLLKAVNNLAAKGIPTTALPNVAVSRPPISDLRILLLTPYTGGNLGDAAIQEALVYHIRKRLSAPKIHLVTLCPRVTTDLHGLPSFPICAAAFDSNIPLSGSPAAASDGIRDSRAGFLQQGESIVRRANWLYCVIRTPWRGIKMAASFVRRMQREASHSIQAFRLLKGTDLLLMSGGGQIDDFWGGPFGHPWSLFKWVFLARIAGARVAFLSVGVCSLRSLWSRCFAFGALRLASYRSYRDYGSKQLLNVAAFTHADPLYPDLAFSYPCAKRNDSVESSLSKKQLVVGISPIACFSPSVWPEHNLPVYQCYIKILSELIVKVLEAGHSVVLFTTSLMDKAAVKDLQARLFEALEGEDRTFRFLSVEQTELNQQLEQIEKMDIVIASRLHGIILAHLLGKPALAISYDRKVRTHMKGMSQERFCLDLVDCPLLQLWDLFTALASELNSVADDISRRVGAHRQQLNRQYEILVKR